MKARTKAVKARMKAVKIHPRDTVAVAIEDIKAGDTVLNVTVLEDVPAGHKFALAETASGEPVVKYGYSIGAASRWIKTGEWVHTHNVASALDPLEDIVFTGCAADIPAAPQSTFMGYKRADGGAGTRNEVWILPTVACVNGLAQTLAARGHTAFHGAVDGVYAFTHPYGCSQLGEDHLNTQRLLAAMARHPNAGGVLVVGLGCENNSIDSFKDVLGAYDPARIKFLEAQSAGDEYAEGFAMLGELAGYASRYKREPVSTDKLVVGLKCGGSDGFSGITANPLLGRFSDLLAARGGATLLTEVPEMFGAERMLLNRCADERTFDAARRMILDFQEYFRRYGQPIDKNPSPGNIAGGLTTNADKSLGCTQKAGGGAIRDVLGLYEPARVNGLSLLTGPGNDPCAVTALMASGAQIILFTTGRGTPLGAPVPVIKVSTNSDLAKRKPGWIDFDAGTILSGTPMDALADELFGLALETASGKTTRAEDAGFREIAIFKDGVTL